MSSAFDSLRQTVLDGALAGPGSQTVYVRESDASSWSAVSAIVDDTTFELNDDVSNREIVVFVSRSSLPAVSRSAWVKVGDTTYRVGAVDASNPARWALACTQ